MPRETIVGLSDEQLEQRLGLAVSLFDNATRKLASARGERKASLTRIRDGLDVKIAAYQAEVAAREAARR